MANSCGKRIAEITAGKRWTMRLFPSSILLGGLLLGASACTDTEERQTREEKTDQAAHKAGEEAYKVTEKTKEVTKEAIEKVKKAGREVQKGWQDAKHKDPGQDHPDSKK